MVADALPKLGPQDMLLDPRNAMKGIYPPPCWKTVPTVSRAHVASVTPGPAQHGEIAGDGAGHSKFVPTAGWRSWMEGSEVRNLCDAQPHTIPVLPPLLIKYNGHRVAVVLRRRNMSNI